MLGFKYSFDSSRLINDIYIINNNICYPKQIFYDISCMYSTRYRLHKQAYCHKTVIAIQLMINEIMLLLDPILKISTSIDDMDKFIKFTDSYIFTIIDILYDNIDNYNDGDKDNIIKAKKLYDSILTRKIYKLKKTVITKNKYQISGLGQDEVSFVNKIGFISGDNTNPLDNIYLYKYNHDHQEQTLIDIDKEDVSLLIPNIFQEFVTMIFTKEI